MQFAAVVVLIVISIKLGQLPDSLNYLHDRLSYLDELNYISNGLVKINDNLERAKSGAGVH